jgi:hypothetical protein
MSQKSLKPPSRCLWMQQVPLKTSWHHTPEDINLWFSRWQTKFSKEALLISIYFITWHHHIPEHLSHWHNWLQPKFKSRWVRNFLYTRTRPLRGVYPAFYPSRRHHSSPEIKRPQSEDVYWPPPNAKIKNLWNVTSLPPHASVAHCVWRLGKLLQIATSNLNTLLEFQIVTVTRTLDKNVVLQVSR